LQKGYIYISIFLIVIISKGSLGQGSWEKQETPSQLFLRDVFFVDSLTGWITGDSGLIMHTENGGLEWEIQQTGITHRIVDIFFIDHQKGWAVSQNYLTTPFGTILLGTDNGGQTWSLSDYPDENIFINAIYYLDSLTGWMGGSPHALVKTTDGGITWTQANIDTNNLAFFPVLELKFLNENYGYASGGIFDIAGVTWSTSNGGALWHPIKPSQAPADEVHGLHIFDSVTVIGAGGDPDFAFGAAVIRTGDGGENWNYDELGIQGNGFDIDFRNNTEGWIPMGPQRTLLYSLDGGVNWTPVDAPGSSEIYDVMFPDPLHGYAVGRDGAFLAYTPPTGVNVAENEELDVPVAYLKTYPNPVSALSIVSYELAVEGMVELKMWNASGGIVDIIVNEWQAEGEYEVIFPASGLPSGIYFCRLSVKDSKGVLFSTSETIVVY
jgi:photosystem II stability/assembly factor-like uncharacterized protein